MVVKVLLENAELNQTSDDEIHGALQPPITASSLFLGEEQLAFQSRSKFQSHQALDLSHVDSTC
jgi:hypothetical protein